MCRQPGWRFVGILNPMDQAPHRTIPAPAPLSIITDFQRNETCSLVFVQLTGRRQSPCCCGRATALDFSAQSQRNRHHSPGGCPALPTSLASRQAFPRIRHQGLKWSVHPNLDAPGQERTSLSCASNPEPSRLRRFCPVGAPNFPCFCRGSGCAGAAGMARRSRGSLADQARS
jgi:hypothetical protein